MSTKTINFEGPVKSERLGDILRTSGVLMKVGTWTPSDGEETTFTVDSISKLFETLNTSNPLWITHDEAGITCRAPIGFAYRFSLNDTGEEIHWEGLVFDSDTINKIIIDGYDSTSMEADLDLDENGIVINGTILGNAFVQNPAVKDETIIAEFVTLDSTTQYSNGTQPAPDGVKLNTTFTEGETMPTKLDEMIAGLSEVDKIELARTFGASTGEPGSSGEDDSKDKKIAELEAALAAEVEKRGSLEKQFEEIKTKEFEAICGKLVEFGIAEPQKIAEGVDIAQRVDILKQFQESLVKEKPAVTTGEVKEPKDPDTKFEELVQETGLGDLVDKYLK